MDSIKHFFTYHTHIKLRWVNRSIIDVLTEEFTSNSFQYYIDAINAGAIDVNGVHIDKDYKLKVIDIINHTVHFHEPLIPKIEIISTHQDFIVVNKPSGIPVHPVGRYFYYSVTKALFPNEQVGCINRLDIPVSGVLIITYKNRKISHQKLETTKKKYVAKVKGIFPKYIEVNEPLGTINGRIHCIMSNGKQSKTIFKQINYKNGYSLVECIPITGRTHQIRIHLSHIGFPIENDILYNKKELEKNIDKNIIKNNIKIISNKELYNKNNIEEYYNNSLISCNENIENFNDKIKYEFIIKTCTGKNNRSFKIKDSFICLHAWKYEYNGIEYEASLPNWAIF